MISIEEDQPLDIENSRTICRDATPAPWEFWGAHGVFTAGSINADARDYANARNDVAFCAHARVALPKALDELEEARAEIARLNVIVNHLSMGKT